MRVLIQTLSLSAVIFMTGTVAAQIGQTGVTGGSASFSNIQPSISIHYFLQTSGHFGIGVPIRMFAHDYNPSGNWISCDGRLLQIGSNQGLFSQLGTQFGGDGRTTFAVPDLRGRTPIGLNTTLPEVGMRTGTASTVLELSNVPPHTHQTANGPCGITGSGQQISNMQPSLAVRTSIATGGQFPPRDVGSAIGPFLPYIGQVVLHAAYPIDLNYFVLANGEERNIASNTALFSILGTTYGGDGRTTYRLPDLSGRSAMNSGMGPGLSQRYLGEFVGSGYSTLSPATLPVHVHSLPGGAATQPSGSSQPFDTMQPTLAMTYCIAFDGVFPGNSMNDEFGYIGEIILFAGNFAPGGYLPCDGRTLSISEYEPLFALIGTTYGGDGVDTFVVPDLRGRVPVGDQPSAPLGTVSGSEGVYLNTANLAAHSHLLPCPADFDHDGTLDFFDYLDFVSVFAGQGSSSDFNHDGITDFFDYLDFVQAFSAGC